MKRTLSRWVYADGNIQDEKRSGAELRGEAGDRRSFDSVVREQGADWPKNGQTMIGLKRLDNLQYCIEDTLANHVPGDLIETGVWRGGATIFMRAILKAYGGEDRRVWVADSFEGCLPRPGEAPPRQGQSAHTCEELAVSLEQVKSNFERYGKLSVDGYLIVDDYGAVPTCRRAVHDYREAHGIYEEIQPID